MMRIKVTSCLVLSACVVFIILVAAAIYLRANGPLLMPTAAPSSVAQKISPYHEEPLMTGFEFSGYSAGGKKTFTVSANNFYLRNKKVGPFGFRVNLAKSAELEGVEVVFYKDGKQISKLNSAHAFINMKTKNIVFDGKPVLITENKRVLSAQKILWDNSEKHLRSNGKCSLGMDGKIIQADSITADVGLEDVDISGENKTES